jgi:NADH:ubiquinone oxidoreductase subunit 6 (subunit J)
MLSVIDSWNLQDPGPALAKSPSNLSSISDLFSPDFYRFFETEGIAILTTLISQYKSTVKEDPQFAHETFEERKPRTRQGLPLLASA